VFSGGDVFFALFWAAEDGSLALRVSWVVGMEGDRYTALVRDTAGVEIASFDGTAHFTSSTIDGCPGCSGAQFARP
jgi:hypothetical protein